jgi:hypothetical protein
MARSAAAPRVSNHETRANAVMIRPNRKMLEAIRRTPRQVDSGVTALGAAK